MNLFKRVLEWLKKTLGDLMMLRLPKSAPARLPKIAPTSNDDQSSGLDLSSMKVPELKALAKEQGVKGYYKLKKADLLAALSNK